MYPRVKRSAWALGLALALNLPGARLLAADVSPDMPPAVTEALTLPKANSLKTEAGKRDKYLPKRPSGPVTVTADRAEWQQAGLMRYGGHVVLSVDTMEMRGDSLEVKQFDDGQYEAHLSGEPAHMTDSGANGVAPVAAEARQLDYDARTGIVEMTGGALLTRGTDKLSGQSIRYDVNARRVQAAGGGNSQVRIVIQPPPPKEESPKQ